MGLHGVDGVNHQLADGRCRFRDRGLLRLEPLIHTLGLPDVLVARVVQDQLGHQLAKVGPHEGAGVLALVSAVRYVRQRGGDKC